MMRYTKQESQDHVDPPKNKLLYPDNPSTTLTGHPFEYNRYRADKCLQACAEILCRIDEAQLQLLHDNARPMAGEASVDDSTCGLGKAHLMTTAVLQECSNKLNQTLSRLYSHMEESNHVGSLSAETNLVVRSFHPDSGSQGSLRLENASVGKDGRQIIICMPGEKLEVKQATAGDRALQFVGSVSKTILQDMIKDRSL